MKNLHIPAIVVAFFGGYLVPTVLLFASAPGLPGGSWALSLAVLGSYILQPVLAGVLLVVWTRRGITANALVVSALGTAMRVLMQEPVTLWDCAWWLGINASGTLAGAWLLARLAARMRWALRGADKE